MVKDHYHWPSRWPDSLPRAATSQEEGTMITLGRAALTRHLAVVLAALIAVTACTQEQAPTADSDDLRLISSGKLTVGYQSVKGNIEVIDGKVTGRLGFLIEEV